MAKMMSVGPSNDYQAESDAGTMIEHARIMGDKKRKKAALAHLRKRHAATKRALDNAAEEQGEPKGMKEGSAGDMD